MSNLKNSRIKIYYILFSLVIFISGCTVKPEKLFDKMLDNPVFDKDMSYGVLYSPDLGTGTRNIYQGKLIKMGKKVNSFLLKKAEGIRPTNYMLTNIACPLTDGDIALCLLLDINLFGDEVFIDKLVHPDIKKKYLDNGAQVWWKWIHSNTENRKWIIGEIKNLIDS